MATKKQASKKTTATRTKRAGIRTARLTLGTALFAGRKTGELLSGLAEGGKEFARGFSEAKQELTK